MSPLALPLSICTVHRVCERFKSVKNHVLDCFAGMDQWTAASSKVSCYESCAWLSQGSFAHKRTYSVAIKFSQTNNLPSLNRWVTQSMGCDKEGGYVNNTWTVAAQLASWRWSASFSWSPLQFEPGEDQNELLRKPRGESWCQRRFKGSRSPLLPLAERKSPILILPTGT